MNKDFDILIIGGGPAGISAGIYIIRAGIKTLVIDENKSMLEEAKKIDNYYGIKSISGKELKERGVSQFKNLGGNIIFDEVLKVEKDYNTNNIFVKTRNQLYECKALILCLGSPKNKKFNGLEKFEKENVSYCAICDGFFYKNKTVAVIGDGDFAINECKELENVANKIYLLTNGRLDIKMNNSKVEIISKKIKAFNGKNKLEEVVFEDNKSIKVDGIFVALGNLSGFELSKQLGLITNNNYLVVDKHFMTNVNGIFAGGDIVGGLLQICKSVSDGAQAGLEAVRYLKTMELTN